MNRHSFVSQLSHSPIPCLAAIAVVALALSSSASCGEIHYAASDGDLKQVKALLKDNPDLVFSTDGMDWTPLQHAAFRGHKDVAELLRQHGGHE